MRIGKIQISVGVARLEGGKRGSTLVVDGGSIAQSCLIHSNTCNNNSANVTNPQP